MSRRKKRPFAGKPSHIPAGPKWAPGLPRDIAAIEAAMESLSIDVDKSDRGKIQEVEGGRVHHLSPRMLDFMKLQQQLFRAVFQREPERHDPVFWDRAREHEGTFPISNPEANLADAAIMGARLALARKQLAESISGLVKAHREVLANHDLPDPPPRIDPPHPDAWAILNALKDTCLAGLGLVLESAEDDNTERNPRAYAVELMSACLQKAGEEFREGKESTADVDLPGTH